MFFPVMSMLAQMYHRLYLIKKYTYGIGSVDKNVKNYQFYLIPDHTFYCGGGGTGKIPPIIGGGGGIGLNIGGLGGGGTGNMGGGGTPPIIGALVITAPGFFASFLKANCRKNCLVSRFQCVQNLLSVFSTSRLGTLKAIVS